MECRNVFRFFHRPVTKDIFNPTVQSLKSGVTGQRPPLDPHRPALRREGEIQAPVTKIPQSDAARITQSIESRLRVLAE